MYKIFFLFIILIGTVDYRIAGLNYWDEALVVVVLLYYIFVRKKISIKKNQLKIWLFLMIFVIDGLISNALHTDYQNITIAILKDIVAAIKFPILMLLLMHDRSSNIQKKVTDSAAKISKAIIYTMTVVAVVGYFFEIGVYQDEVRFVKCYKFFFSHPTFFVSSLIMMISVLMADGIKKNKKELILTSVLLFLSGRTKAYIMIAVLVVAIIIKPSVLRKAFANLSGKLKIKKRYLIVGIVVISLIAYVIGKDKVMVYMSWGLTAARPALYIVGFYLMRDCFPFGSGFGTFASSISGQYYSNVYGKYNISNVNGLIRGETNYIADTFPPYIYGQFGILGAVMYVLLIVQFIKVQIREIKVYDKIIGFFFLWLYALVACSAEAFLTNASGAQLAVILAIYIGKDYTDNSNIVKQYKEKK